MSIKCLMNGMEVNYPCSHVCALFGDCVTAFEAQKKENVRTNADRIRSMTDEELSILLNKIVVNHHIKNSDNCNHCPMKGAEPCDTEGIIDWLKQQEE